MQNPGGMNELVRQAKRMQRKMEQIRSELKDHEITASAAAEKVSVTVSCEGKLRRIDVDRDFLEKEGLELALDSVVAAANSALEAAEKHVEAAMTKATGGIKIPGM